MCLLFGVGKEERAPKEGIVAYRVVRVTKGGSGLSSVYSHYENGKHSSNLIPLRMGVKMKAKNLTGTIYPKGTILEQYPTRKNECGFHAFRTYREALSSRAQIGWFHGGLSVARVRLFGRIAEHPNGYRGEYMTIEAIVCGRRPKEK